MHVCVCMRAYVWKFVLTVGFALYCKGLYMLHFGEMAHKTVHYYFEIKKIN